jgi:hypothetical protein
VLPWLRANSERPSTGASEGSSTTGFSDTQAISETVMLEKCVMLIAICTNARYFGDTGRLSMETRGYTLSSLVCDLESIVSCYSEHVRERRVNADATRRPCRCVVLLAHTIPLRTLRYSPHVWISGLRFQVFVLIASNDDYDVFVKFHTGIIYSLFIQKPPSYTNELYHKFQPRLAMWVLCSIQRFGLQAYKTHD